MDKKEVAELKRRFKRETCTITKISGCYVDGNKNIITTFHENFLSLEDEEFLKYLEIVNKALSGKVGNNLLDLEFPIDEEIDGGRQQMLMALRETGLEQEAIVDRFFEHVIETYDFVGNYLILLFHDVYDVMSRTSDNIDLDESDEAFKYIIGCICPVALSKAGLGYREDEQRIAPRIRDWVVGACDTAFTFPAFNDRSTDIHHVWVYTKNAKEPHKEFWEMGLGVNSKLTATEKKEAFTQMVVTAMGPDNEETPDTVLDVQQNLNDFIQYEEERKGDDEPVTLRKEDVEEILTDAGLPEDRTNRISKSFEEFFGEEEPEAEDLLDTRSLKGNEVRAEKKKLQKKVVELEHQLEEAGVISKEGKLTDVVVKISEERVSTVETAFVDGRKCIVIPLEADDRAIVNGEDYSF